MTKFEESVGYQIVHKWLVADGKTPFTFQLNTWKAYHKGNSGMVVAPTGFGKTYSVFLGVLIDFMNNAEMQQKGLKLVWISPIRSLAKDLAKAMQDAVNSIGLDWTVETRNGDTDPKQKERQTKQMPDVLIVTPESLHLMLAQKKRAQFFKNLQCIVVDEWHELLGSKRGIMVELAVAYLQHNVKNMRVWGITATIGNVDEAMNVLLSNSKLTKKIVATERNK